MLPHQQLLQPMRPLHGTTPGTLISCIPGSCESCPLQNLVMRPLWVWAGHYWFVRLLRQRNTVVVYWIAKLIDGTSTMLHPTQLSIRGCFRSWTLSRLRCQPGMTVQSSQRQLRRRRPHSAANVAWHGTWQEGQNFAWLFPRSPHPTEPSCAFSLCTTGRTISPPSSLEAYHPRGDDYCWHREETARGAPLADYTATNWMGVGYFVVPKAGRSTLRAWVNNTTGLCFA